MVSCYETTPHRLGAAPFPNDRVSRSSSSRGTPPIVAPRLPGHTMQRPEAHCSIAAVASCSPAAKAAIPCQRKLIKSAGALSAARPFQQRKRWHCRWEVAGAPQKAPPRDQAGSAAFPGRKEVAENPGHLRGNGVVSAGPDQGPRMGSVLLFKSQLRRTG